MSEHDRSWFWQDYWQQGQLACCLAEDLRAGYDGLLAETWRDFFAQLPAHAAILDICTGNGGVSLLAAESSVQQKKQFNILGVDLAPIEPAAYVRGKDSLIRQVRFEGGVDAASLPYDTGSVDASISQFGVEYAGLLRSAPEAARVLRPGGQLRFVLHAVHGLAEGGAKEELALVPTLGSEALHNSLRDALIAVDSLTHGRGTRPAADAAVETFVSHLEALDGRLKEHPNQATILTLGRRLMGLFEAMDKMPVKDILARVDASERGVEAHLRRLESLAAAACSEADIIAATDVLEKHGVNAGFHALMDGADMLGWVIEGRKG